jgi:hypothetical protein
MSAADALAQLQSFQQPDSATVLSEAQKKYGIQGLQDRVNTYKTLTQNLTGSIAAVDPSVTGRTSGSLVTEGQRGALVNRERAPLVGQLGTANQGLGMATGDFNVADTHARGEAQATIADNTAKYNRLKDAYELANQQEQQAAEAARQRAAADEARRQFDIQQATTRGSSGYSGGSGKAVAQVNPAGDFLKYIQNQFKSAGKNPSRQTQDAWANAWFSQNGVSNANRQGYWDLYNSTYKRTSDPTKDHLYKR